MAEIESSPSGLAYEIVLKPASESARRPSLTPKRPSPGKLKREDLEEKLKRAEELRKSHESEICNKFQEKKAKIEQIKKVVEENQAHIMEEVEKKLNTTTEYREAMREAMLARLHAHDKKIEEARQFKEKSVMEKITIQEEKLQKKLVTAEQNREILIKEKLEKLQAHDAKILEAKQRKRQLEKLG